MFDYTTRNVARRVNRPETYCINNAHSALTSQDRMSISVTRTNEQASITMDNKTLDKTTLTTISLLEARLLRLEQLLYGATSISTSRPSTDSALDSLADLERRFSTLISRFRVYADILKLCTRLPLPPSFRPIDQT